MTITIWRENHFNFMISKTFGVSIKGIELISMFQLSKSKTPLKVEFLF